jgi:hypothetical protein
MFDSIATLAVAQNMRELFRLVLVDTPLAPYFSENLTHEDLDEMNIEVRGWTLWLLAAVLFSGHVKCNFAACRGFVRAAVCSCVHAKCGHAAGAIIQPTCCILVHEVPHELKFEVRGWRCGGCFCSCAVTLEIQ